MKWRRGSGSGRGAVAEGWECGFRGSERAFTLVEMTIASGLMAIVLMAGYACFQAGIQTQRLIEPRLEALQTARVALALLTADLRCATPLAKGMEFVGANRKLGDLEAGNLDFGTLNRTPRGVGEGDFCQTSYFVEIDPGTGERVLWRRRNPRMALDPLTGGSREEIARGVRQLKFEFYDGYEWYETWGDAEGSNKQQASSSASWNLSGMPEAVRITLSLELGRPGRREESGVERESGASGTKEEVPLTFQTVARIQVPKTSSTTAGGTSADGGDGTSSPSGANPGGTVGGTVPGGGGRR